MNRYVLDSFALLALLQDEPGADRVDHLLTAASRGEAEIRMSLINLAEVQYQIIRRDADPSKALAALEGFPIVRVSADAYVPQVVELKANHPISLADCFAAALAQDLDCPLVTGDPEFKKLEGMLKIEWLR